MVRLRLYLILFAIALSFFFYCDFNNSKENILSDYILSLKEYPNDLFSFQRSYPYSKFDIKAYEGGLKEALLRRHQRNSSPGFDEAWTSQGPANIGARVNTIEVHPTDENTLYLGFCTGGVFKTTDGGTTWNPIFDDQPFLAIGDITLDPNNSETVYVGTGDPNISGYPAIGNGIYKSIDGGLSWTHLGLSDQRIISKIIINPDNSDILYVSCMGLPFERNNERGLYKSIDGGLNWEQVLLVSNQSGIIDMVMNPDNPQILYAASWDRIRNNEESLVNGPNAKIHKSIDGGISWTVLTNGLPTGDQGRIGLAISALDPQTLVCMYVGVDNNLEGIYRTEDGGELWSEIPTDTGSGLGPGVLGGFGWYFGQIRLHPTNDNWIYLLGVTAWLTTNNGVFWAPATNGSNFTPHVDYHDLVFNFQNDIIVGSDGGAYKKENNSLNYADIEDIPTTQFYRVAYDPHHPDDYYGGTQDNGSNVGNGNNINSWSSVLGGDGFQMRFHPTNPNIVFAETQNGNIFRSSTGLNGFISSTSGINPNDRRHWDMQYFLSPHDPDRLYTGTYRVYKSQTSGTPAWVNISPDLTDGDIYGSPFHTITTLTESPLVEDLLYVGTTDGNVWRTEDGGVNWDSLHATLPNRYITSIKTSPDIEDNVFVCISGYRYNEYIPRVYKSTDRGNTWSNISGDLPDLAVNDIIILPEQNDQILFVATDGGIYASTNGGSSWELLGTDMPMVTVYDMEWNEANNQLVAGTFGRSIYSYPIDSILNNLDPTMNIGGQVLTQFNEGIDSVLVNITGDITQTIQTDINGDYVIENVGASSECVIEPNKNINIRNGLSTIDIINLQKHILFLDTLDSPYKIIAGDINHSNTVTTFDLVNIRKVILFAQDTFINTDSWRFIPADFVFTDPIKPFLDNFPETVSCDDIQNGESADFIGLKVGDVTGNADPSMIAGEVDHRNDEFIDFLIENQLLQNGKSYRIPVYAKEFKSMTGFQFGLKLSEQINLESIESGLIEFDNNNYFLSEKRELRISWSNPFSTTLNEGSVLFYLNIKSKSDVQLNSTLEFQPELLRPEAYNTSNQIFEPQFIFKEKQSSLLGVVTITPNPFFNETKIGLNLNSSDEVMLSIYNMNGQLEYYFASSFSKGRNELVVTSDQIKASGIYFYEIKTSAETYVGKIVKN
jgi:photosystem II stability/assembly factor-like uncharacterized protein